MAAKKKKAKGAPKKPEQVPLEEAMEELTSLVAELESGQQPLGDALEKFEQGMKLLKECSRQLDDASGRIEIVRRLTEDGVETEPFDGTATIQQQGGNNANDDGGSLF